MFELLVHGVVKKSLDSSTPLSSLQSFHSYKHLTRIIFSLCNLLVQITLFHLCNPFVDITISSTAIIHKTFSYHIKIHFVQLVLISTLPISEFIS